jgi:hypothetical protein
MSHAERHPPQTRSLLMRSRKQKQLPRRRDTRTYRPGKSCRPGKSWLILFEQDEVDESLYIGGGPDEAKEPGTNVK